MAGRPHARRFPRPAVWFLGVVAYSEMVTLEFDHTGWWSWPLGLVSVLLLRLLPTPQWLERLMRRPKSVSLPMCRAGSWRITLRRAGPYPIPVIRVLRGALGLDLESAHQLVTSAPAVIADLVDEGYALALATRLRAVRAEVDVRQEDAG